MFKKMVQLALTALGVGYIASPIDFVPDFIPVVGEIDDTAVFVALAAYWITWWFKRRKQKNSTLPAVPEGR